MADDKTLVRKTARGTFLHLQESQSGDIVTTRCGRKRYAAHLPVLEGVDVDAAGILSPQQPQFFLCIKCQDKHRAWATRMAQTRKWEMRSDKRVQRYIPAAMLDGLRARIADLYSELRDEAQLEMAELHGATFEFGDSNSVTFKFFTAEQVAARDENQG